MGALINVLVAVLKAILKWLADSKAEADAHPFEGRSYRTDQAMLDRNRQDWYWIHQQDPNGTLGNPLPPKRDED